MALPSPLSRHAASRRSRAAQCDPQRKSRPRPPHLLGSLPGLDLPVLPPRRLLGSLPVLAVELAVFLVLVPLLCSPKEQRPKPRSSIPVLVSFFLLLFSPKIFASEYLLRQPHRLRQSIIADQQINLDPFVGSLFVDGQAQRAQRTPLQAYAENRSVTGIRDDGSRQEREAAQFIFSYKCLGSGSPCRAPLLYRASTLHRRNRVGHRIRGVSRGIRYARRRFQFVRHFVRTALAPVYPAHRADQHGRSGQRPCSNYSRAPHFQCHMPRAELLAQTHLHARGRLRHGGIFRERAQLNSGGLPGVLQRGAT